MAEAVEQVKEVKETGEQSVETGVTVRHILGCSAVALEITDISLEVEVEE
jgi:hypothetical protein